MVPFVAGLFTIVFGFYLYHVKEGPASTAGSLFTVLGLLLSIYGLVSFLVPTFFK